LIPITPIYLKYNFQWLY